MTDAEREHPHEYWVLRVTSLRVSRLPCPLNSRAQVRQLRQRRRVSCALRKSQGLAISARFSARVERCLCFAPPSHVVDDELHEVLVTIPNDDIFDGVGRLFARPRSLPRRSVSLQPRARHRDPVAEPLAGIREVTVPAERGGDVLVGVVGAEPVQVQRGEFPDEFGVSMPERRHNGCQQPVGASP